MNASDILTHPGGGAELKHTPEECRDHPWPRGCDVLLIARLQGPWGGAARPTRDADTALASISRARAQASQYSGGIREERRRVIRHEKDKLPLLATWARIVVSQLRPNLALAEGRSAGKEGHRSDGGEVLPSCAPPCCRMCQCLRLCSPFWFLGSVAQEKRAALRVLQYVFMCVCVCVSFSMSLSMHVSASMEAPHVCGS